MTYRFGFVLDNRTLCSLNDVRCNIMTTILDCLSLFLSGTDKKQVNN